MSQEWIIKFVIYHDTKTSHFITLRIESYFHNVIALFGSCGGKVGFNVPIHHDDAYEVVF